jgi:DNA-binding beta-propeller fold protein YncE
VAPDGRHAFAIGSGSRALQSAVREIDLISGAVRQVTVLPGEMWGGLAVTGRHVFAAHTAGNAVWMLDRANQNLVRAIPVGKNPTAVVLVRSSLAARLEGG